MEPTDLVGVLMNTNHRPFAEADPTRQFATFTFFRGGLIALAITLMGGILGAFYTVPQLAPFFQSLGFDLRHFRSIHTTFPRERKP